MDNLTRIDDLLLQWHKEGEHSFLRSDVAIYYEDKAYTYKDLYFGMMKVVATLTEYHLFAGEKIIVHLGNRPEAIMAIMGISYMGHTFVPVPDNIKSFRLTEIVNDCGAKVVFTDERHQPVIDNLGDTSLIYSFNFDELKPFDGYLNRSKPANPAALMYTSGTTGKPKGVVCPHEKMLAAVSSINAYMMHTTQDIIATALPLSHGYGLYQILTVMAAGGKILLEPNFAFPQQTLHRIKTYKATGFATVPSAVHMIMQIENWEQYLGSLSYLTTAGAALSPSTFDKLKEFLLDTDIVPMYGQAECVRALQYPAAKQRCPHTFLKSCGIPIPDTKTRILVNGKRYKHGTGELVVKSPHVMDGYWNNPEETNKTFVNGWLHTGDVFAIDKETGYHFFVGRYDDVIKIKGERCAPQELDDAIVEMPEVNEAATFAIDDGLWGKRFVAYVSSKSHLITKKDVMRHCKQTVEAFLMPKDVVVVKDIPKNENGKVSRVQLKAIYEGNKDKS